MAENVAIAPDLVASTWMNIAFGMLMHEGSILVVILNAMRLMRFHER